MRQTAKRLFELLSALWKGIEVSNAVYCFLFLEAFMVGWLFASEIEVLYKVFALRFVCLTVILVWLFYSKNRQREETVHYDEQTGQHDEHGLIY